MTLHDVLSVFTFAQRLFPPLCVRGSPPPTPLPSAVLPPTGPRRYYSLWMGVVIVWWAVKSQWEPPSLPQNLPRTKRDGREQQQDFLSLCRETVSQSNRKTS